MICCGAYISFDILPVEGSNIDDNATINQEILFRIQRANASFAKLYHRVWKKKHLRIKLKAQIYRTVVFPSRINKRELEFITNEKIRRDTVQILRTIPAKYWRDKISYAHLLQITVDVYNQKFDWANGTNRGASIMGIETYRPLVRLRYAGHIARMSKTRIPNIFFHGEVDEGMRKPGIPKKAA